MDIMSKKGLELFNKSQKSEALKKFVLYLKNKKKLDKSYYDTHKMIDKILKSCPPSNITMKWFKKYNSDPEVQIVIAKIHYLNNDYEESVKYLKMSNTHMSLYLLGNMYSNGVQSSCDVEKDDINPEKLFNTSSNLGNRYAQYTMGNTYKTQKDIKNAKKYYLLSANQGDDRAQYCLGLLNSGDTAKMWFKKSMNQGNSAATDKIISICNETERSRMIVKFEEKSKEDPNNLDIIRKLCKLYQGRIPEYGYKHYKNGKSARTRLCELYPKLIQTDGINVLYHLGHIGMYTSYSTAMKYFLKAAELGCSRSQYNISLMHFRGIIPENRSIKTCIEYLELSANQDNIDALALLGEIYLYGIREDGSHIIDGCMGFSGVYHNTKSKCIIIDPDKTKAKYILKRCIQIETPGIDYRGHDPRDRARLALSQLYTLKPKNTADIYKGICYGAACKKPFTIKKILSDNYEYLEKLCQSVYIDKGLDKIDVRILSKVFKTVKEYVEQGKKIALLSTDNDLSSLVNIYTEHYKNKIVEMKKCLNGTTLHVNVLNCIIERYLFEDETF
jgi:TPR repeat protein